MRVRLLHLPILIGLLAGAPALAQEEPVVLTWERAWEIALENNETYATAEDELVRAKERVGEAWAAALPTVSATGAYQHYFQVPQTIFVLPAEMNIDPQTGQSMGPLRIKTAFSQENNVVANVELQQTLWAAGKVGLGLDAAKQYRKMSELGVQVAREDLRVDLVKAYYATVLAEQGLTVTLEMFEMSRAYLEQVRAMHEQGMVSEYDLIRAEVAVANMKPMVTQAETGLDLAYKSLKNMLGMDLEQEIEVDGDLMDSGELLLGYEQAVQLANQQRVEFRQLDFTRNLYEIQTKVHQRSWLWPNFFASLKWETMAQKNDTEFAKYEFLGGYGATVGVSIPLFDGLASHHRAQQAKVDIRNTQRARIQLERGVEMQVYAAQQEHEKAREQLEAALEARNLAERGYEIAEVRYSEGVGTQLEVLDAHSSLSNAKMNVLQAEYNLRIAKAEFDRAIGQHFTAEDFE